MEVALQRALKDHDAVGQREMVVAALGARRSHVETEELPAVFKAGGREVTVRGLAPDDDLHVVELLVELARQ